MRSRDRLGAVTDAMVQPRSTRFLERSTYRVVRTDDRPSYHYGNYLLLDHSPAVRELDHWFEKCRFELADLPVERLLLQWETEPTQMWGGVRSVEGPMLYTCDVVMSNDRSPEPVTAPSGVQMRPFSGDRDWDQVVELSKVVSTAMSGSSFASFARWRYAAFRAAADEGLARWWGAFEGDELIGSLGLFESPSLFRFQEVQTHTDHRRRGVCKALCRAALASAFAEHPSAQAIIVAAEGSPGRWLYQRLGFEPIGVQHNLQRAAD